MRRLGRQLRDERKRRKETIFDVARRAGISGNTVSRVERGYNRSGDSLERIAEALDLELSLQPKQ